MENCLQKHPIQVFYVLRDCGKGFQLKTGHLGVH